MSTYPPGHEAGPRLAVDDDEQRLSWSIDTIRAVFTYTLALVVVVGGGLMLYATRLEQGSDAVQLAIVGFIGGALTFAFGQEVQSRTARQAATATAASAASKVAEVAAANSGVGPVTNGAPSPRP
jgi:hypothetical protein